MREDFLVMLDWQPHVIRAGVGMGEVIPRPRVEIAARAAYRKSQGTASGSVRRATDYLVGPALDEAERSGEELEIVWPLQLDPSSRTTSSSAKDGEREQEQGTSSSSNSNEKENGNDADQGSMKVDEADEGSAGKESSHNVSDGVQDWEALEALFRYILFTGLQMPSKPVNFMILLAIPSYLPPTAHERLTQMFFESYNIANFLIVERALVQLYSCAAMTGITVDVGLHATEVAVIHDAQIHPPSLLRCSIGEAECDQYLVDILLEANPDLPTQLSSPSGEEGTGAAQQPLQGEALYNAVLRLVNIMKDGEYIRFQVDKSSQVAQVISSRDNGQAIDGDGLGNDPEEEEEGITDVAKALASGKVGQLLSSGQAANVTVVDGDKIEIQNPHSASLPPILVGLERNRYVEPLFNPSLLSKCTRLGPNSASLKATSSSLPETIANAVQTLPEVEKRGMVWENIVFTGSAARVKGAASALIASLQRYAADVPAPPETASVQYSRRAKHARTPDYFSEFRERPDMTSFLGASIYAKLGFLESQGGEWLTKQDYNEYGPSIATRMNVNGN